MEMCCFNISAYSIEVLYQFVLVGGGDIKSPNVWDYFIRKQTPKIQVVKNSVINTPKSNQL